MSSSKPTLDLQKAQSKIASKVRALRKERRWTQVELAKSLGLSQSRLSELEQGGGSFTAEQFLLILQLFNVSLGHFALDQPEKKGAALQNALARLGAVHLQESAGVLPSEQLEVVADVIRETLIAAESPRHLTALAPVLVRNISRLNLKKLHAEFVTAGLEQRFAWLIENTTEAIRRELRSTLPRPWAQLNRRAEVVLGMFLDYLHAEQHLRRPPAEVLASDILDPDIRSRKSLEEVRAASSDISRRWGVTTSLQPEHFAEALKAVRADY